MGGFNNYSVKIWRIPERGLQVPGYHTLADTSSSMLSFIHFLTCSMWQCFDSGILIGDYTRIFVAYLLIGPTTHTNKNLKASEVRTHHRKPPWSVLQKPLSAFPHSPASLTVFCSVFFQFHSSKKKKKESSSSFIFRSSKLQLLSLFPLFCMIFYL